MEGDGMNLDDLSNDLKAKALECKSADELLKLAREEGIELSDEQLDAIAGGWDDGCDEYTGGYDGSW